MKTSANVVFVVKDGRKTSGDEEGEFKKEDPKNGMKEKRSMA